MADRQVLARALDQGVALAVGRRQGEQPGGLVDDQDVPVLVQDPQPGGDVPRLRPVREERDGGIGLDLAAGLVAEVAGHVDPSVPDRLLRRASGEG